VFGCRCHVPLKVEKDGGNGAATIDFFANVFVCDAVSTDSAAGEKKSTVHLHKAILGKNTNAEEC
tara:strand:+ start:786 stop:980 length:195 start_codon:yes stop_codon:yes gene_type:complete